MPVLAHHRGELEYLVYEGDRPYLPTVVLLHEGLGSAGQWGRLPALISARTGMSTLVYSRHGYGSSAGYGPTGPDYLHSEALTVLPEVLSTLGIERPFLVGHSDGASIAAIYASEYPVAGAVLIAPHVFVEDVTLNGIRQTAESLDTKVRPSLALFHDDPDALFRKWSGVWLSDEFATFDITEQCRRIGAPLLLVQGENDQYGSVAQLDRIVGAAGGDVTRRVLPGHGHHPHLQNADEIGDLITEFIAKLEEKGWAW
ncbi:alpha/beta hydrolase [Gordonia sp. NPDC003585]|uniref:alpha/beta fold hydrolase n=1 Tax=Gordonia sp. NPDC003585 TaxID=3154275 RepID=UPI0033B239BA